jgi:pilus assembly protein TadC
LTEEVSSAVAFITRVPRPYAVTLGFVAVAAALSALVSYLMLAMEAALSAVPILPGMVSGAASMLGPMIMARMLGLLVREHAEEIWSG